MIKWSDSYFCEDKATKDFVERKNILPKSNFDFGKYINENNLRLPLDYKKLVLDRNGGSVADNSLKKISTRYKDKKIVLPKDQFVMQLFFGITDIEEFNIMYFFDGEYLAKKMLPIALDCGGNKFLLNVSNSSENGKVFLEIHDEFDENDECCVVKIADSFTDFVSLIIWDK